jgi:cysteine desulfurase
MRIPGARLTGHPDERLPNSASFVIEGVEGESLLLNLDLAGIAASSGSACSSGDIEPSHVLTAMGYSASEARGTLRLTLGRSTDNDDIRTTVLRLPDIVGRLRGLATSGASRDASAASKSKEVSG